MTRACFLRSGGLAVGMLFEGFLLSRMAGARERAVTLGLAVLCAAALNLLLDAIGVAIILHVAIGRRWPYASPRTQER